MLALIHRVRHDEHGQTLVLAAVSMLVLALLVMATINIGQATYERIDLQNNADAAAYSLAATQARGLNFIAYTNRAMLVHYSSILTLMSYLSFIAYIKNTWGRIAEFLSYLPIPYVQTIADIISTIIDNVYDFVDDMMQWIPKVIGAFNYVLFAFQEAMLVFLEAQIVTDPDVLTQNDPDVTINSPLGITAKIANAFSLNQSIDFDAQTMVSASNRRKVLGNEPRQVLADLINSTRHSWVAGTKDGFPMIGRIWHFDLDITVIPGLAKLGSEIAKEARTEHGMFEDQSLYDQAYAVDSFYLFLYLDLFGTREHVGFRYLSEVWADYDEGGHWEQLMAVRQSHKKLTLTGCKTKHHTKFACCHKTSCWPTDLVICTTADPVNAILNGIWSIGKAAFDAWTRMTNGTKHHKYLGGTPYVKFEPRARFRAGFGQIDLFIVASKENDKMNKFFFQDTYGMQHQVSGTRVQTKEGTDGLVDFSFRENPLGSWFAPGYNAISVARVYYHRPGDWKEHPNFFNPFWGAKLHPVAHHTYFASLNTGSLLDEVIVH